jgi:cbb3-type cytochrome c oxidase subunit II
MKRFLRMSYLAAGIGGLGFFAMSILLLGVWPGHVLEQQIRETSPDHPMPLTASEQRGRVIYGRDGCAYCHTQQIRSLDRDIRRFGAATMAWETIFDYPQLWGTRRIGPDLSREGAVRSPDWQLSHLYDPRHMVPDSVMPPFPWLFDGAPDRPKQAARDLLAYIETLGRNRELAEARVLNASAAMTRREGDHPKLSASRDRNRGTRLYARNCAGCHGRNGEGDGPGASGLHPRPANFAAHEYTLDRLSFVLWNGVAGTAMPAWRDLSVEDLSDLAQVVRGFHSPAPPEAATDLGRQVYEDHCAQCHDDGPAANRFPIASTDFRTQRASYAASLRAIRDGVEGTPMAPWTTQLSDVEIDAVARYARGLYQP